MTARRMRCTMCGHDFDPAAHVACQSCPLQKGCSLVCCPQCGYEMINLDRSFLARLFGRWLAPQPGVLFDDHTPGGNIPIDRKTGP